MRRRTSALLVGLVAALLASPSAAGAAEARVAEARAAASSAPALVGVRVAGAVTGPAVADGTFVVRLAGEVYRVVGGAPVYVSTWSVFGGPQPVTPISSAQLAALPRTPADGTLVLGAPRGEVYRFVGGAPLYVSSWSAFGEPHRSPRSTWPRWTTPAGRDRGARCARPPRTARSSSAPSGARSTASSAVPRCTS